MPNNTLAQVAKKNLTALNDLKYDAEELNFALRLQESFLEKAPLDDIANALSCPTSTVRSLARRGLERLRTEMT